MYDETFTLAGNWRSLARGLRLSSSLISLIASKYPSHPEDCLFTALEDWLKKIYNTERYGHPSWHMLVKAVANPAGGANTTLAEAIAQKHSGKERILPYCIKEAENFSPF